MCKAIMDIREEGKEEGRLEGGDLKLITLICRKLQKGKAPAQIAEDLEEDFTLIESICSVAIQFSPDYNYDKIYQQWKFITS